MGFKLDFGRLFPGLLIFLIGAVFLVIWLILAVLLFFLFFIPGAHWVFYFVLDVGIAAIFLMGIGALIMLTGVSGWVWKGRGPSEPSGSSGRRGGWIERRAEKDRMKVHQRFGELFGLFISFLVLLYFAESQWRGTGFFTNSFGTTEQLLFYGPWVFSAVVVFVRASYGRRNPVRPLEVVQNLFSAFSALWLLSVFPFDFAHLPDLLPQSIHFMFFWLTNQIGALGLLLFGIGTFASALYTSVLYLSVRSELRRRNYRVPGL